MYFTAALVTRALLDVGEADGRTAFGARARLTLRELKRNSASFIGRHSYLPHITAAGFHGETQQLLASLRAAEHNPPFFPSNACCITRCSHVCMC